MPNLKRTIHKAQGFSKEQIKGYCLLPHSHSAIAITNRLTGSQFRLWHYLMMIDPFADRNRHGERVFHQIPSPAEIASAIGSNPRTVEKDMKRLEELGLYTKRTISWQGYNLTAEAGRKASELLKQNSCNQQPEPLQDKDGYLTKETAKQPDPVLNSHESGYLTEETAKQPDPVLNSRDRSLKLPVSKASTSPQTIQTYSNFIQTLSDSERENFEKYVREEWKRLTTRNGEPGQDIVSIERFLAREEDIKSWYDRFLKSPAGRAAKQEAIARQYDWENDPRLMDWLHKAYYEGHPWAVADAFEREERLAFLMWAQKTNAYAGRIADEPA